MRERVRSIDKRRAWTDEEIDLVTRCSADGMKPGAISRLLEGRSPGTVADLKRRYGIVRTRHPEEYPIRQTSPRLVLGRCAACGASKDLPCPVPRCERYQGDILPAERTLGGVAW